MPQKHPLMRSKPGDCACKKARMGDKNCVNRPAALHRADEQEEEEKVEGCFDD